MELAFLSLRAQLNRRALLRGRWRDGGDAPPPPVLEFEAISIASSLRSKLDVDA